MIKPWPTTVLAVSLLAMVTFLGGLGGEFVLDDRPFLVENPKLDSAHSLVYFFSENIWSYSNIPDAYSASYRPLFFLVLWLHDQLGIAGPFALHLFSLVLHTLATILLLMAIRVLIPGISPLSAGIAAGLFAVHPVHVEAVAWISAFVHPLATVFLLASWLAHDKSQRGGGAPAAIAAAVFFALALLSNEMAVAFPLFILISDRARHGRVQLCRVLPYFLLLTAYMALRRLVLDESVPLMFLDPELWLRMPVFLLEYLRQLLIPWPQPFYLQMPGNWGISAGAILAAGLYLALWQCLRRYPTLKGPVPLIALSWTLVFLLPPLTAAFSPDARFALRSLYLPSAGIAMLLAWAVHSLPALRRPPGVILVALVLLLALGGTIAASRQWKDDGEVYGRIIAWNPAHNAGYLGLGQFHERRGEIEPALKAYEQAISFADPAENASALEQLARLSGQSGNNVRSLDLYEQLTVIEPNDSSAWNGMGNNLWALGHLEAAADAYQKARVVDPGDWITCHNLVLVLKQLDREAEARRYVECAQQPR